MKNAIALKLAHKMKREEVRKGGRHNSFSFHLRRAWSVVRQIKEVSNEMLKLTYVWREPKTNMNGLINGWQIKTTDYVFREGIIGFMAG